MTLLQIAMGAGVVAVLAVWCLSRALVIGSPSVSTVYRRLYGDEVAVERQAPTASRWERPFTAIGRNFAGSATGQRMAERRAYEMRVVGTTVAAIATRVAVAALVGFLTTVAVLGLPMLAGLSIPLFVAIVAPFAVALLTGWYQYESIILTMARRYREFRAGVAAYIQLVSVCLTTRRSASEAVTYAADIGSGKAFETIGGAVHAAPQMGLQAWEALDAVGAEYGARELEDLATSIANVSHIGVGVESTVVSVAARMRQVGLDEMQRQADRQTAAMFGPTMLFVLGTIAFLAYPLVLRVLDAFTTTT